MPKKGKSSYNKASKKKAYAKNWRKVKRNSDSAQNDYCLPVKCVAASHDQSSSIYEYAMGKQCACIAYCSIAYHLFIKPADVWSQVDLDSLMLHGSLLYEKHAPINHAYFAADELPNDFMIEGEHVKSELIVDIGFSGYLDEKDSVNNIVLLNSSISKALELMNGLNGGFMFTMVSISIAVLKSHVGFHIFDSHSRNLHGRPSPNGQAGLFTFTDKIALCKFLITQSNIPANRQIGYELCLFKMNIIHSTAISGKGSCNNSCNHSTENNSPPCKKILLTKNMEQDQHHNKNDPIDPSFSTVTVTYKTKNSGDVKNCEIGTSEQSRWVRRYAENESYREQKKTASKIKYRDDGNHREYIKVYSVEKYDKDTVHRDVIRARSIQKYKSNAAHREMVKTRSVQKYENDTTHREMVKTRSVQKYENDTTHREMVKTRSVQKYENDTTHKEMVKTQSKIAAFQKYHGDSCHRDQKKLTAQTNFYKSKLQRSSINNAIIEFHQKCLLAPTTVCCVCLRIWFSEKVKVYKSDKYADETLIKECLEYYNSNYKSEASDTAYICNTCDSYIQCGKVPPQATINNMQLCKLDSVFKTLNSLEQQLISLSLPFQKIITLPRSRQKAMKGPVVCVPSNINFVTNALPIPSGESKIVPVYLKRKLMYKGHSDYQLVDTVKLNAALLELKQLNPLYADVKINENWNDIIDDALLAGTDGHANTESDEAVIGDDIGDEIGFVVPGHFSDSCLQPVDLYNELCDENIESVAIAPGEGNRPVSLFHERFVEAKSFPGLFPDGKNTYDAEREYFITRCNYYKARIYSADTRFASNSHYIFFAQYAYEAERLLSSISINLRKGSFANNINAAMLRDPQYLRSLLKTDQGFKFFEPVRGSPEFWKRTMADLFACLRNLGLPTFFATFTSAELTRWACHIGAILKQRGDFRSDKDILNMDYIDKCEVLKSNPVTAVRMFYRRVELFFSLILKGPSQPLGKIKDYFYRVEFQARGSPHIHCLFWIEDAPIYQKDNHQVVCDFIDKYIKATLPSESEDPELFELVSNVQIHSQRHSVSCRKGSKKTCRFNFPKPCSDKTFIVEPHIVEDEEFAKSREKQLKTLFDLLESGNILNDNSEIYAQCGFENFAQFQEAMRIVAKKPSVVLKRSSEDVWINNYNPDLLLAWNANIDIQYVVDPYSCIMYIISYISKSEAELGEILKTAREEIVKGGTNCNEAEGMKLLARMYFTHREVSIQEAVVRLAGLLLRKFSRKVVFVPTDEDDIRMSKPLKKILESHTEDSDVWMTSIYDRYCARPCSEDFKNMCLARFVADYRIMSLREAKNSKSKHKHQLADNLGYIIKRTRTQPAVIRYCHHSQKDQPEKYYLSLLKLFLPHKNLQQLKPSGYSSYQEFHELASVQMAGKLVSVRDVVSGNEKQFNLGRSEIDEALSTMKTSGYLEDAWAAIAPNTEYERHQEMQDGFECTDIETEEVVPELQEHINSTKASFSIYEMSADVLKPLLREMNNKQKEVFYYVRNWCKSAKSKNYVDPFHIFVTGGAGVGKSHLIKCIYGACTKILRKSDAPGDITMLLLAPTGSAAHNINGQTIHSAFKIPIENSQNYKPLSCESLNTLKAMYESLKIIILDEISMVSPSLFGYLDSRLRQIKGISQSAANGHFGRVSVIAVGDFHQLPPVMASPLLLPSRYHGTDLFKENFQKAELTEIMRQKNDTAFAKALNKLRVKRKGEQIDQDIDHMLRKRTDLENEPAAALHVFATNKKVERYNTRLVHDICDTVLKAEATDFVKDINGKLKPLPNRKSGTSNDLPDTLEVGINARVVLVRNIDTDHGLVNGVFGVVVGVKTEESKVAEIYVKFDSDRVGMGLVQHVPNHLPKTTMSILPKEELLASRKYKSSITRRQFPLKLGWASTVHKTQGLSLSQLVYDMEDTFAAGQGYVALSRVTSINGLFLKNYSPDGIYRDDKVYAEVAKIPDLDSSNFQISHQADIVLHNIQGLNSKLPDIKATYGSYSKIMCMTETWLNQSIPTSLVEIPGFCLIRQDRQASGCRGGVGIYVHDNIPVQRVKLRQCSANIECVLVKLALPSKLVVLGCIYRAPRTNVGVVKEEIRACLMKAEEVQNTDGVIITGDLNENLRSTEFHPLHEVFLSHGYQQMVAEETYISGSQLDNVYFKRSKNFMLNVKVCDTYFSDHESVEINFQEATH